MARTYTVVAEASARGKIKMFPAQGFPCGFFP